MRSALGLTLCMVFASPLAACGSESSPTPAAQAPRRVEAPALPETVTPPEAAPIAPDTAPVVAPATPPEIAAPTRRRHEGPRLSAAQRATLAAALQEGRQLTRAGQHREALTRFEAALAIAPGAWRVECEAAFVAWRAEDAESADAHVRRALLGVPPGFVPEAQRVPTAMCLFNAGLIHAARGRTDQARDVWEASIRLRPNATVSARLAALPPSTFTAPPWQSMPATTPLDVLLAAMRDDACANGLAAVEAGSDCSAARLVPRRLSERPDDIEAYLVDGDFPVSPEMREGDQLYRALVVRSGGVLHARVLGQSFNAGLGRSNTNIDVRFEFDDVLPGGRAELMVHVSDVDGSSDGFSQETNTSHHVILCSTDSGVLRCISLPLASVYMYTDDDGDTEEGFCQDVSFGDGRATFVPCLSGPQRPFIEGVHDVRILLERGDLRWPDVWETLEPVGG